MVSVVLLFPSERLPPLRTFAVVPAPEIWRGVEDASFEVVRLELFIICVPVKLSSITITQPIGML